MAGDKRGDIRSEQDPPAGTTGQKENTVLD